jgi:hypothetical protein
MPCFWQVLAQQRATCEYLIGLYARVEVERVQLLFLVNSLTLQRYNLSLAQKT